MGLITHQSQFVEVFLKKSTDSFEKLSWAFLNIFSLYRVLDFTGIACKLIPFFTVTYAQKLHNLLLPHNSLSLETPLLTKTIKSFFKKISFIRTIAYKSKFRGGRYFWIFRRRGYFWNKKKILQKKILDTWDLETSSFFSFFVKMKFVNFLKSYWSFFKIKKKIKFKFGVHDISDEDKEAATLLEEEYVEWNSFFKDYVTFWEKAKAVFYWNVRISSKSTSFNFPKEPNLSLFLRKNVLFTKNLLFMFAKEMVYTNFRKQFTNYYIFKTFEFAYHEFWQKNEYSRLLEKFNFFKKNPLLITELISDDSENDFEFSNEFITEAFESFKLKPYMDGKRKRRDGKKKRLKRRAIRYTKVDVLNFFFKKLSPLSYSASNDSAYVSMYNNYFYNFFFLDVPNFSEEIFENQEYIEFLLAGSLHSKSPRMSVDSSNFLKKKFIGSNYAPLVFLPDSIKVAIITHTQNLTDSIDHKYIQHFITSFISHVTSFKSLFLLNSNLNNFKDSLACDYTYTVYEITSYFTKIYKKFFKNFQLPHFIEFFSFSLFKKDLNFFVKFFKKCLEEMSLKKHKKVLYSFEFMLKKFLSKFFIFTQVLGLKFEITGKISVTGNSKTRNKIIKYGCYSLTNKSLRIDYLYDIIRTTTGVLGFRIYLTY